MNYLIHSLIFISLIVATVDQAVAMNDTINSCEFSEFKDSREIKDYLQNICMHAQKRCQFDLTLSECEKLSQNSELQNKFGISFTEKENQEEIIKNQNEVSDKINDLVSDIYSKNKMYEKTISSETQIYYNQILLKAWNSTNSNDPFVKLIADEFIYKLNLQCVNLSSQMSEHWLNHNISTVDKNMQKGLLTSLAVTLLDYESVRGHGHKIFRYFSRYWNPITVATIPALFTLYGKSEMIPANHLRCPQDFDKFGVKSEESSVGQQMEMLLHRQLNDIYGDLTFNMVFMGGFSMGHKDAGKLRGIISKGKSAARFAKYNLISFLLASTAEIVVDASLKNYDLNQLHKNFQNLLFPENSEKSFEDRLLTAFLLADKYFLSQEQAEQRFYEFNELLSSLINYRELNEDNTHVYSLNESRTDLLSTLSRYTSSNRLVSRLHKSICLGNKIQEKNTDIWQYWNPQYKPKNRSNRRSRTSVLSSLRLIYDDTISILKQRRQNFNDLIRFLNQEKHQLHLHVTAVEDLINAEKLFQEKIDFYSMQLRENESLINSDFLNKDTIYHLFTNIMAREHQESDYSQNWNYLKQEIKQTFNCPN
ncbi:MAG: hypothetical protein KDD58_10910 [Bdellovibrionales bacterium]|nr:hypothetical protein [Bdellovibrionales bacterium]